MLTRAKMVDKKNDKCWCPRLGSEEHHSEGNAGEPRQEVYIKRATKVVDSDSGEPHMITGQDHDNRQRLDIERTERARPDGDKTCS